VSDGVPDLRGKTAAGPLMRRATYASVATALLLVGAKLLAYLMTDSVSLLSTLLDSLLDVAASLVGLPGPAAANRVLGGSAVQAP